MPSKSKKNASLRLPAKNVILPAFDDVGLGAEGHLGIADDLRPDSFGGAGFRAFCHEDADSLLAVLRLREHVAERDVGQAVAVVVDVEAVNGVGMQRVGGRICIEDDHGSRRIRGRQECVEVAEVESLVAERRAETEAGEMIRHGLLPCEPKSWGPSLDKTVTNRRFDVALLFFDNVRARVAARACLIFVSDIRSCAAEDLLEDSNDTN